MNNTVKELLNRKSVRVFTDKKISKEDKDTILLAAANAPTAGNMQLYSIIDITTKKAKEKLSVLCDNQPFIKEGKMVLIFVADYLKWVDAFSFANANPRPLGKGDLLLAIEDAMCAAQNAVTAANSLNIGSCYIGDIMENHDEVKELLNLPDTVYPVCMLVFGYPTKQQIDRVKPERIDMKYLIHKDTYKRKDEKTLEKMFSKKVEKDLYKEYLSNFCKRKYNSNFSKEMNRSARKYLKEFK